MIYYYIIKYILNLNILYLNNIILFKYTIVRQVWEKGC